MKREGETVAMDDVPWLAAAGDGGDSKTGENSSAFAGKNRSVQDLGELNFPEHSFPGKSLEAKSPLKPKEGLSGAPVLDVEKQIPRSPSRCSGSVGMTKVSEGGAGLNEKSGAEEEMSPALELMQQALETETQDHSDERERRIYRGRTVGMLRRYMRYSIETGRLPSLLGKEFFRTQVTSYGVGSFEDRVIFVHDMEICLAKLDEFSRQLIARHILEEHDQAATGRLLQCTERTVRTYVPMVLDTLSEILLDVGLLERLDGTRQNSCQGGRKDEKPVSDCEIRKNKGIYILAARWQVTAYFQYG